MKRQMVHLKSGGLVELFRKIKLSFRIVTKSIYYFFFGVISIPIVLIIRLIRPWVLIRISPIRSERIGHFALETEMYLSQQDLEINVPQQNFIDLFYFGGQISNMQLAIMWKRILHIWPAWILAPIDKVNHLFYGAEVHIAYTFALDTNNLLDRRPQRLKFTSEEERRGEDEMRKIGVPIESLFVCLIVRDCAYLDTVLPGNWSYHSYRDSNIQNYVLVAEELAERGYFVIRMGAKVSQPINTTHPKIIDYATNGHRNDFMDIYLASRCSFCISTGTGWDIVPSWLFKKPVVFTNMLPIAHLQVYTDKFLITSKRHIFAPEERELTLSEIIESGAAYSITTESFQFKKIRLLENTPEEIRDVVIEMYERLNYTWKTLESDEILQKRFWEIYPGDAVSMETGEPLHGEIRSRFSTHYLRNNPEWLS